MMALRNLSNVLFNHCKVKGRGSITGEDPTEQRDGHSRDKARMRADHDDGRFVHFDKQQPTE